MGGIFRKKRTYDPRVFGGLKEEDKGLIRQYVSAVSTQRNLSKREDRRRREDKVRSMLGTFGKAFPKGIRLPDDVVRNEQLYIGHKVSRKNKVRLF